VVATSANQNEGCPNLMSANATLLHDRNSLCFPVLVGLSVPVDVAVGEDMSSLQCQNDMCIQSSIFWQPLGSLLNFIQLRSGVESSCNLVCQLLDSVFFRLHVLAVRRLVLWRNCRFLDWGMLVPVFIIPHAYTILVAL
jgi:hypothetical protein